MISFGSSWFFAKNLSNYISLPEKLHNRYCHNLLSWCRTRESAKNDWFSLKRPNSMKRGLFTNYIIFFAIICFLKITLYFAGHGTGSIGGASNFYACWWCRCVQIFHERPTRGQNQFFAFGANYLDYGPWSIRLAKSAAPIMKALLLPWGHISGLWPCHRPPDQDFLYFS